jgi:hypothetical protein
MEDGRLGFATGLEETAVNVPLVLIVKPYNAPLTPDVLVAT